MLFWTNAEPSRETSKAVFFLSKNPSSGLPGLTDFFVRSPARRTSAFAVLSLGISIAQHRLRNTMERLESLCAESRRHVRLNPPGMEPFWDEGYEERLQTALDGALQGGADPHAAFKLVKAASKDLDQMPEALLRACIEAGLSPDTDIDRGQPLLHHILRQQYPPKFEDSNGGLTLRSVLDRCASLLACTPWKKPFAVPVCSTRAWQAPSVFYWPTT